MVTEVVEGWTGPLDFQLKADGTGVNLTGSTIELLLKNADGSSVDTISDVSIVDAPTGKVRYDPDTPDLVSANSPLRIRWKVADSLGKIVYFPNGEHDQLVVHAV